MYGFAVDIFGLYITFILYFLSALDFMGGSDTMESERGNSNPVLSIFSTDFFVVQAEHLHTLLPFNFWNGCSLMRDTRCGLLRCVRFALFHVPNFGSFLK